VKQRTAKVQRTAVMNFPVVYMHVHHFLNLIMHAHRVEVGFLSCHQILLIRTMASSTDRILFSSFLTSKNRTHLYPCLGHIMQSTLTLTESIQITAISDERRNSW
jgi:hypothetical protein